MIEADLVQFMENHTDLSALVGSRIDALIAKGSSQEPRIVFTKISNPEITYGGKSRFKNHKFQIDLYAAEYKYIKQAESYFMDLFDSYSGSMGSSHVYKSNIDRVMDMYESASKTYRLSIDVSIKSNN